jgi:hypothetical protein
VSKISKPTIGTVLPVVMSRGVNHNLGRTIERSEEIISVCRVCMHIDRHDVCQSQVPIRQRSKGLQWTCHFGLFLFVAIRRYGGEAHNFKAANEIESCNPGEAR